jgi:hypothetical protein
MPNVRESLYMISKAWRHVDFSTIENCWKHCDIVSAYAYDIEVNRLMMINYEEEIKKFDRSLLKLELSRFAYKRTESAKEYIELDQTEPTEAYMSDQEIFEMVENKNKIVESQDEEPLCEKIDTKITFQEALSSYKVLFGYLEQSGSFSNEKLLDNIERLKDELYELEDKNKVQFTLKHFLHIKK